MLIEVGRLKSKIISDNPQLLNVLYDIYSIKIKGAEHSMMYKRKLWDGKKKFMTRQGEFRTGLLSIVLEDLKKIDCYPDIKYTYKDSEAPVRSPIPDITYYPFQETLIDIALNNKRCILESATGSGKTIITAGIVESLKGKKIVILFPKKHLVNQTYDFLVNVCKMDNIGINHGEAFIYGDVMLSTVQSIEKIIDSHLESTEVLIIDEVHEFSSGKTRVAVIESFPNAEYRIGLTATVPDDKEKQYNILGALGPVYKVATTSELIEGGILTKPLIQIIPIQYNNYGDFDRKPYLQVYKEFIVENTFRNNIIKDIVDVAYKKENNRVVIIVNSVEHGRLLEKLIHASKYISGEDSLPDRYKAISDLRKGKYQCLIGTVILQTGVSIDEITHFINARGLESKIASLQALGRSLRLNEGKDKAYVYDFADSIPCLHKHYKKRLRHYKKEGHDIEILPEITYEK
jgi:superfamily II DNA or RNA helicase